MLNQAVQSLVIHAAFWHSLDFKKKKEMHETHITLKLNIQCQNK